MAVFYGTRVIMPCDCGDCYKSVLEWTIVLPLWAWVCINLGGGARGLLSHRRVDSGGPFVYQLGSCFRHPIYQIPTSPTLCDLVPDISLSFNIHACWGFRCAAGHCFAYWSSLFLNQTLSVSILLNVIAVVCITKACQYFWNLHSGGAFSVLFNQGTTLVWDALHFNWMSTTA